MSIAHFHFYSKYRLITKKRVCFEAILNVQMKGIEKRMAPREEPSLDIFI
ncbi:hypothetical protein CLOSCI_02229 [[Clostridium] scindens ATCC 35704]|nr:hypothetical protein CLOSCI_02229 [[Clostridium] scindens ATCC 35704]